MINPAFFQQMLQLQGSFLRVWRSNPPTVIGGIPTWQELILAPDAQGLVGQAKRRVEHSQLGWVTVSELTLTVMPDEIPLGHLDRVLLTTWELQARETVECGVDVLNMGDGYGGVIPSLVSRVTQIGQGATVYVPTTDYTVDLTTGTVEWVGGRGPMAATNYTVEYYYHPLYQFRLGEQDIPRPSGFDSSVPGLTNMAMPMTGVLQLEQPGQF